MRPTDVLELVQRALEATAPTCSLSKASSETSFTTRGRRASEAPRAARRIMLVA